MSPHFGISHRFSAVWTVEADDGKRGGANVQMGGHLRDPGHVVPIQEHVSKADLPQRVEEFILEVVGIAGLDGVLESTGGLPKECAQALQERRH